MPQTLEERVAALEAEVKAIRQTQNNRKTTSGNNQWVNTIFGAFKDDPLFEEAVKEGEAYRKAQVPDYMQDDL